MRVQASSPFALGLLVVGLVIGLVAGGFVLGGGGQEAEASPTKKFYVAVHEWSFAFFDENWNRLDRIEVNKGDRVVIVVVPKPFLPMEVYEQLEEEFIEEFTQRGLLKGEEDFLEKEHQAEEDLGKEGFGVEFIPHSFSIRGLEAKGADVILDTGAPAVVEFVADEPGEYDVYCNLFCGWGHGYMNIKGGFVVQG